jgi:predicted lipoprotein with Yx(FWY)xxD motif
MRPLRKRPTAALLVVLALALLAAACTGSGGATAAGGPTVGTATSALGTFLTGPDGRTLYMLTTDAANTTTCTGACSDTWPPFTVTSGQQAHAGGGMTGTLATFKRPDGTSQVTYGGRPLYYFKGDAKAGDANGQGTGGVWFVAAASGEVPTGGAPGSSPAGSPAGAPGPTATPYDRSSY